MKTQTSRIATVALGVTTIAVAAASLWLTPRAWAGAGPAPETSNASRKPPHGGGSFYATVSTVSGSLAVNHQSWRHRCSTR
jgi:hypothetical protein